MARKYAPDEISLTQVLIFLGTAAVILVGLCYILWKLFS